MLLASFISITLLVSFTDNTTSEEYLNEETTVTEKYVVITRTGECYHDEDCWTIKHSVGTKTVPISDAEGYYHLRACSKCSPD
jgi:hypothetical protein